jgi:hypothetical protein
MEINLEKIRERSHEYAALVEGRKQALWEEVKKTKFQTLSPEELSFAQAIWMHGFTSGADVATQHSFEMYSNVIREYNT